MDNKLPRDTYPSGLNPNDFQCFGPAATKDGAFEGTMIADMGCFKQDGIDSNKYYHGAVVQSRKDQKWFAYFEWGRTGSSASFQFVPCSSKDDAQSEYAKQLHSKNDKRGEWINHPSLGRILQAKADKDCYLVRPLATRSTGLPDAKTITQNEGSKQPAKPTNGIKKAASSPVSDPQTMKLMRDLNVGTVKFTRGSIVGDALPTQTAIDEARDILSTATKRVGVVGDKVDDQVNDTEIKQLTSLMYGRIPKKKERNALPETWILNKDNIFMWNQDLDAFESALYSGKIDNVEEVNDPFGGMKIKMEWLGPNSTTGEFIRSWMPHASRNMHGGIGDMKIQNVWSVERDGDPAKIAGSQNRIINDNLSTNEKPLHQPKRTDIEDRDELKRFVQTHTWMLFHGTRSVNVSGILREALRMPKQLVGVVITGALYGGGIYFADDWKKSAGYCSLDNSYWAKGGGGVSGRGAFMFVADVVMGKPFIVDGPRAFTQPPKGHHSVFAIGGGYIKNNEIVVYSADQHRLRYLVEFKA
jgi:hypothetical protein